MNYFMLGYLFYLYSSKQNLKSMRSIDNKKEQNLNNIKYLNDYFIYRKCDPKH